MKAKNEDGTWNVYDCKKNKYIKVSDEYLDAIPRKNISELEERVTDELKVVYTTEEYPREVWYELIHGTWGFPCTY